MDENDIGGAGRECNSVLVWGDLQVPEPVENGIAVHLGLHQSFLDGDELLKFDEAGRVWAVSEFQRRGLMHQLLQV